MNIRSKSILGASIAAFVAATVIPAAAAPAFSNRTMAKSAIDGQVTDVRWRGGGAVAAGVIGGLALGALAARPYYYSDPYAYSYGPTYYAPTYAPSYYEPSYGYGPSVEYYSYTPRTYGYSRGGGTRFDAGGFY